MGLKIAILGTRGIPNNYGGFEHIAGHLALGLVLKNHEVTVYNSSRHPYQQKEWHGVKIIHCFDPENIIGVTGQFIYDLNCILDAGKKNYDIILQLGYTSSSVWGFLYPSSSVVITNMDGLEWQRTKYSKPVRKFLQYAEKLAVKFSDHHVADSEIIQQYLDEKYAIHCKYIGYGAAHNPSRDERALKKYGVVPYDYFLLMARMEPENNIELILDGYCSSGSEKKFLVIGDTGNALGKKLVRKYRENNNIIFTGGIFNEHITQSLTAFCAIYFHGHTVGGTNPSLLDAMAAKAPVCAHNNDFNRSVLKGNAIYFNDTNDVVTAIGNDWPLKEYFIQNNLERVRDKFNWKKIIDQYENYFIRCHLLKNKNLQVYELPTIKLENHVH